MGGNIPSVSPQGRRTAAMTTHQSAFARLSSLYHELYVLTCAIPTTHNNNNEGKTTVSCWVTRSEAVRTTFAIVAWITLGQTPVMESCVNLLHLQLTGSALPDGVSTDQKDQMLQQAFRTRSVLLILDDCWDVSIAKQFTWIDQSTNSKVLISSRVRDVLDGGKIIDVNMPSSSDAVKMLLKTAEMNVEALEAREEVAHIAELCKRLPLTIGVAGKLIRQLAQGSNMSEASNWTEVVLLLEDEMKDPGGSLSIEESVIRASIKAIPIKIQTQVTRLFYGFALAMEDTHIPLMVLGMIYDACADSTENSADAKPLSRLQVRRYLKVLIDRSLVLGTVDRPQLHDVMLDYVQKELQGGAYKLAQRSLVERLRKSDRSPATVTGKYIQQCMRHHIVESRDAAWEKSTQAIAWLEDHIHGVQDLVASSAASILPVEALAVEAELAERWWQAALRWNAFGLLKMAESGGLTGGNAFFKKAVKASSKAVAAPESSSSGGGTGAAEGLAQFDLDSFDLHAIDLVLKAWHPADLTDYGPRMQKVLAAKAGRSRPIMYYAGKMSLEWFPGLLSGNEQVFADECWNLIKINLDMRDESTDLFALSNEDEGASGWSLLSCQLRFGGDRIINSPGFHWDMLGPNGDIIFEHHTGYKYDIHHPINLEVAGNGILWSVGAEWVLALQYGRIDDAMMFLDGNLAWITRIVEFSASAGYALGYYYSATYAPPLHHIIGSPKHVRSLYTILDITFDNVAERLDIATKSSQGHFFTTPECKEPGAGLFSLKRAVWHIKSMCILDLDVPEPQAIAWLKSLPDNEAFYAYSMTMPHYDHGTVFGAYQACWIALAHEKVGLFDGALRFVGLQMETDMLKAGTPLKKWPQVISLACKGRVLAKLNRHAEALVAFQAAIATAKQSYSMMEAFAYRELANFAGGEEAAVQAGVDLDAKLKTFEGRMTRDEFDGLTIGQLKSSA